MEQINEWLEQTNELGLLGLSQNSGPSNFCPWYICWEPSEAPVRNGVLERVDNVKRGRGRPKSTWDESVKRDLKDWNIYKEIALDRSAWRLAINVPEL